MGARKKIEKRKAKKKEKKMDDLAEQLATSTTVGAVSLPPMEAAAPGLGSKGRRKAEKRAKAKIDDANMEATADAAAASEDRSELRKKLRAKLARDSLERTWGQNKAGLDSRGMPARRRPDKKEAPQSATGMDQT